MTKKLILLVLALLWPFSSKALQFLVDKLCRFILHLQQRANKLLPSKEKISLFKIPTHGSKRLDDRSIDLYFIFSLWLGWQLVFRRKKEDD